MQKKINTCLILMNDQVDIEDQGPSVEVSGMGLIDINYGKIGQLIPIPYSL